MLWIDIGDGDLVARVPNGLLFQVVYCDEHGNVSAAAHVPCTESQVVNFLKANEVKDDGN